MAAKKAAKKATKRTTTPLVKVVEKKVHWSKFLMTQLDACSIPDKVRHAPTPQQAWDRIDASQLIWALNEAGVSHDFEDIGSSANEIRKKYPTPPQKLQGILARWLKAPATQDDLSDDDCY